MKANNRLEVKLYSIEKIPTRFGRFSINYFHNNQDNKEHLVIQNHYWREDKIVESNSIGILPSIGIGANF